MAPPRTGASSNDADPAQDAVDPSLATAAVASALPAAGDQAGGEQAAGDPPPDGEGDAGSEEPGGDKAAAGDQGAAPASAAGAAVAALLSTIGQGQPTPAATAAATSAVAILQPALAQQPTPAPAAGAAPRLTPAAAPGAIAGPPATPPARQPRGGIAPGGGSDAVTAGSGPAGADDTQATDAAQTTAAPDDSVSRKDPRPLPDLRLPDGGASQPRTAAVAPSQAPALPAASPQPAMPAEALVPADGPAAAAGGTASGTPEAPQSGRVHAAGPGETRPGASEAGSGKGVAPSALPDIQVTAFGLDAASSGATPHVAGLHRDVTSGTPAAAVPGQLLPQTPAVPVQAVPIEIGMRVLEGAQQFTVRLHPEDLGRVDVRIGVDDDGKVTAQLVVDKVETLAMLQRDSRTLERAFDQAGLKTSEGSLQFTLNTGAGQQQAWSGSSDRQQQQTNVPAEATKIEPPEDLMAAIRRVQAGPGGLDIRI
jgi:flagellar hook-length control protein FliK